MVTYLLILAVFVVISGTSLLSMLLLITAVYTARSSDKDPQGNIVEDMKRRGRGTSQIELGPLKFINSYKSSAESTFGVKLAGFAEISSL